MLFAPVARHVLEASQELVPYIWAKLGLPLLPVTNFSLLTPFLQDLETGWMGVSLLLLLALLPGHMACSCSYSSEPFPLHMFLCLDSGPRNCSCYSTGSMAAHLIRTCCAYLQGGVHCVATANVLLLQTYCDELRGLSSASCRQTAHLVANFPSSF